LPKKLKAVFFVFAAIILVGVGVFASILLAQRFIPQETPDPAEEIVKTNVVVMTRDLYLGDTIAPNDVQVSSMPVDIVPRNTFSAVDDVVGKIVKTDLIQGEMILAHNLADPTNNNNDLSFILSDDHVLLAFPADDLMSRESMVQRGDIVDIFATFTQEVKTVGEPTTETGEPEEPQTRTFTVDTLQKVDITALVVDVIEEEQAQTGVLGAEGETDTPRPQTRIRAYLLALSPQDALILKHLKDTDAIFDIVLRSPTSTVQFELTPVTEGYIIELYGLEILP